MARAMESIHGTNYRNRIGLTLALQRLCKMHPLVLRREGELVGYVAVDCFVLAVQRLLQAIE